MARINIMAMRHSAYDKLLDVFLYSGLISKRHAFEACVTAPPDSLSK